MTFHLSSPAFSNNGEIPQKHTCDGQNLSPELRWGDAPSKTQTFALIVDDPDAPSGRFVHWLLFNIPATAQSLPEAVPQGQELPPGMQHGTNGFRQTGYGGPCPPRGPAHRYFFHLYALDTKLDLPAGAGRADLDRAIKGHILADAELMARYKRRG